MQVGTQGGTHRGGEDAVGQHRGCLLPAGPVPAVPSPHRQRLLRRPVPASSALHEVPVRQHHGQQRLALWARAVSRRWPAHSLHTHTYPYTHAASPFSVAAYLWLEQRPNGAEHAQRVVTPVQHVEAAHNVVGARLKVGRPRHRRLDAPGSNASERIDAQGTSDCDGHASPAEAQLPSRAAWRPQPACAHLQPRSRSLRAMWRDTSVVSTTSNSGASWLVTLPSPAPMSRRRPRSVRMESAWGCAGRAGGGRKGCRAHLPHGQRRGRSPSQGASTPELGRVQTFGSLPWRRGG